MAHIVSHKIRQHLAHDKQGGGSPLSHNLILVPAYYCLFFDLKTTTGSSVHRRRWMVDQFKVEKRQYSGWSRQAGEEVDGEVTSVSIDRAKKHVLTIVTIVQHTTTNEKYICETNRKQGSANLKSGGSGKWKHT